MVIWRFRVAAQKRKKGVELGVPEAEAMVGRGHGRKWMETVERGKWGGSRMRLYIGSSGERRRKARTNEDREKASVKRMIGGWCNVTAV